MSQNDFALSACTFRTKTLTGGRRNVTQGIHLTQIFQGHVKCKGKGVPVHDKKEDGRFEAQLRSILTSKFAAD